MTTIGSLTKTKRRAAGEGRWLLIHWRIPRQVSAVVRVPSKSLTTIGAVTSTSMDELASSLGAGAAWAALARWAAGDQALDAIHSLTAGHAHTGPAASWTSGFGKSGYLRRQDWIVWTERPVRAAISETLTRSADCSDAVDR